MVDNVNNIFGGVNLLQEWLFGSVIGSEASHNDTDIEEQAVDVEQSKQSATPPTPSLPSSLSAQLPQIPYGVAPQWFKDVKADARRSQVPLPPPHNSNTK